LRRRQNGRVNILHPLQPPQVEAIERATLHAVSPEAQTELAGWILPFDPGTVGRARSAVPLAHAAPELAVLRDIEAAYVSRAFPVMLRIPLLPAFERLRHHLAGAGYREHTTTEVQVADAASVRAVSEGVPAQVLTVPTDAWASVFLGEGFDPVDGASRVRKLGQAEGSVFATLLQDERPVAAGAAAFSHGWASIHGMRTAQDRRGRGLAGQVLATLAAAAIARGYEAIFLQVAANNASAQALYRRAGFSRAWAYSYWVQPGA
jgi:ribosomal protein S18 acetylase RimI-like enzyme